MLAAKPYRTGVPASDLTATSTGSSVTLAWRPPPTGEAATAYKIEAGSTKRCWWSPGDNLPRAAPPIARHIIKVSLS
jgi:hypothetical protein